MPAAGAHQNFYFSCGRLAQFSHKKHVSVERTASTCFSEMEVVLQVPDQYLLDISAGELAARLKLSAALLMFRAGKFSAGAACEFAGVDRYTFFEACRQHRIDVVDYNPDELEADLAGLIREYPPLC